MDDWLQIEQFYLSVFVSRGMRPAAAAAVRRILNRPAFRAELLRAALAAVRRHRELARVTVTLSR